MYDNPIHETIRVSLTANQDDLVRKFKGPSGMRGRVIDVRFSPTATTALGASATIKAGSDSDDDKYATLTIATGVTANTVKRASVDGTVIDTEDGIIGADENLVITVNTSVNTDDIAGDVDVLVAWW